MANYAILLAQIAANIYSNNNQDITGDGLQLQLNAMVASLGAGYQFMGVAHPADTPSGYADLRAFWLAGEAGTYTDFGGIIVNYGEFTLLKYDGNWSKEVVGEKEITLTTDNTTQREYISTGGMNVVTNGYFYSRPIYLNKGDKISFRDVCDGVAAISLCEEALSFPVVPVVTTPSSATNVATYSYTAIEDCYVVVSGKWASFEFCHILLAESINGRLSNLEEKAEDFENIIPDNFAKSLHTFGSVVTADNYSTILPDLNDAPANSIIIVGSGLQNIANTLSSFGTGATIITTNPWKTSDMTGAVQILIPSYGSAMFFRNRWSAWGAWQMIPRSADVETIAENLTNAQSRIFMLNLQLESMGCAFSKVLFIGDSLTQGAYYGTPYISKIGKNFPNMFCRRGNIAGSNQGYSGIDARGWYGEKALQSYLEYDLVVLWLGTNSGFTDTMDTDVIPYNDYHNYADTNTGCLCKIIESIRENNPRINIILLNCFATSGDSLTATNKVISEVAEKYDLPLFDTSWLSLSNNPSFSYHAGVNNVHLGIFGAFTLANRLWTFINEYFTTNWSKLENGAQAEINPSNWTYINR